MLDMRRRNFISLLVGAALAALFAMLPTAGAVPEPCDGAGDVVATRFRVEPGDASYPENRWFAWLNDQWVFIPPNRIAPDYAPDGTARLFIMTAPNEFEWFEWQIIACFVRPRGG
jgi:hypothetical protein